MAKKVSADDMGMIDRNGPGFTFPLPIQIEGLNARGTNFTEFTVLSYISHRGSSFFLKSPVNVGSRLKLVIDLPEKLSEDKNLKLVIKGKVSKVDLGRERGPGQKVTILFDSKYIIKPEE